MNNKKYIKSFANTILKLDFNILTDLLHNKFAVITGLILEFTIYKTAQLCSLMVQ